MNTTLFVADRPFSSIPTRIRDSLENENVYVLNLAEARTGWELPEAWQWCDETGVIDESDFREVLLAFLEDWPLRKINGDISFDKMFRRLDGYSVWWTSVGASRTPNSPLISTCRRLWLLEQHIQNLTPTRIVLHVDSAHLVEAIWSRFGKSSNLQLESTGDRVHFSSSIASRRWLLTQFAKLPFTLLKFITLWLAVRIACPRLKPQQSRPDSYSIVFAPKLSLSRNIQVTESGVKVPYWDCLVDLLKQRCEGIRTSYILNYTASRKNPWSVIGWLRGDGRALLRNLDGAVRPVNAYCGLFDWLRALPNQTRGLVQFYYLTKNQQCRQSMHFLEFDVSAVLVPLLKRNVESLAAWERSLGQFTACFSTISNPKVFCVLGEFYPGTMQLIAAAKRLGIPVVAAQHGTICTDHYIYTVPRGHVMGAPTPDLFAAYGEYSQNIVSELGSFPKERTEVTGAPRLDALVNQPKERASARKRLGLPLDKQVILFAAHSTRSFPWFVEVAKATCVAALDHEDCIVCLKFHPGETKCRLYKDAVRESGNPNVRFFRDGFDELLVACDVLISGSSTTILEAALLRIPAISANFTGKQDRYPYIVEGAALPARDPNEMRASLDAILDTSGSLNHKQRLEDFLRKHVGPTSEGNGTEYLASLIQSVLESQPCTASVS